MKKLLNRSLKPMLIYALLVSVGSIPVYFLIIDFIWLRELDKHHYGIKRKLENRIDALSLPDSTVQQTVSILNRTEPGFTLTAVGASRPDSLYTLIRFDPFLQDREQFRCLVTSIRINNRPYRLLIETNMEEIDETVLAIAGVSLAFFVLLLGGFVFLNRRLARKIWQPFYASLGQLKEFNLQRDQTVAFAKTDILEFAELNDSLRQLIARNIAIYQQQKEFAENASHELQTPLAVVQSKLDLLLQNENLTARQGEQIELANRALARVSRINKNLLLLARLENQQFADRERVDLSQLVTDQLELLADFLENSQLTLTTAIQPGIEVEGNRLLIEIAVTNLLFNAIRHSPETGKISVRLANRQFTVANSGSPALNPDNLFKRFSTVSAKTPSSGLGLAIVREISNRYGWSITYTFTDGQHIFALAV
ncbi:sensor histidine kinase [Larkinella terrae]|nr:HAMP domain-containing sensor histidine kinase [Larkinella terrae]